MISIIYNFILIMILLLDLFDKLLFFYTIFMSEKVNPSKIQS